MVRGASPFCLWADLQRWRWRERDEDLSCVVQTCLDGGRLEKRNTAFFEKKTKFIELKYLTNFFWSDRGIHSINALIKLKRRYMQLHSISPCRHRKGRNQLLHTTILQKANLTLL